MRSIAELIQLSTTFLQNKGVDRPRRIAEELLAHALSIKRIDLYLQYDRPVEEEELARYRASLLRRAAHEPIEYIIGEVSFFGTEICVDRRVLIPRPETEILLEHVVRRARGSIAWDLCTGSGCIGIALKKKLPHLSVTLSDISAAALQLARENAERNEVEVEFVLGDLLRPFRGRCVDFVVCNPPYIAEEELMILDRSVRIFEPKIALDGGREGCTFYRRLANELPAFLNEGGQLFLEIGRAQGELVQEIFSKPPWVRQELLQDWSGKDRFFFLEKQLLPRV